MQRVAIVIFVLILFGCKASKKQSPSSTVIIMMEKTSCMGTCPTYKFEVFLDKTARYNGKAHVDMLGEYTTTLTDAQLDNLENSFAEADYFSFANVYSAQLSDLPTTFLFYHNRQQSLKVTDYWGAPQELKDLEQEIEEIIAGLDWKKTN